MLTLILARIITYFISIFNMSDVNCSGSGEGTDAVQQKTRCSLREKFIKVLTDFRLRRVRQSVTNAGCSLLKKFVEVLKGWRPRRVIQSAQPTVEQENEKRIMVSI